MALGRKSIYTVINVTNTENPEKPYKVIVQANKNHGICDISVGTTKKVMNEYVDRNGHKFTKTSSEEIFLKSERLSDILSAFQGRQYDDEEIIRHLHDVINERLNIVQI